MGVFLLSPLSKLLIFFLRHLMFSQGFNRPTITGKKESTQREMRMCSDVSLPFSSKSQEETCEKRKEDRIIVKLQYVMFSVHNSIFVLE